MEEQLLTLFGLTPEQVAITSGAVLLIVEYIKTKLPQFFSREWTVVAMSLGVAFVVAIKMLYPDWVGMLALSVAAVIISSGAKTLIKKIGTGKSD